MCFTTSKVQLANSHFALSELRIIDIMHSSTLIVLLPFSNIKKVPNSGHPVWYCL